MGTKTLESPLEGITQRRDFWEAADDTRTTFCSRRLRAEGEERLVFRSTVTNFVFGGFFFLAGVGTDVLAALLALGVIGPGNTKLGGALFLFLFGALFAVLGGWQLRSALRPLVFDRRAGYHWRGMEEAGGKRVPLGDVLALQFLDQDFVFKGRVRHRHELNLVLKSGKRVHVLEHGARAALLEDAQKLGRFLDVPVLEGRGPDD